MKELNPQDYGLGNRIKIVEIGPSHLGIVKKRKSRIIMKDGKQIIDIANKIREFDNKSKISLIISGPICSKTIKYLSDSGVGVLSEE